MRLLADLIALRLKALGRGMRDHAATVFVLGPLVAGAGLLLLARVGHDLGARVAGGPAAGEPWLWAAGTLAAGFAARGPAAGSGDPWPTLPLPPSVRLADRYLAGLARLAPVIAVLAVAAGALGGGPARWTALAALALLCPLLAVPARLPGSGVARPAGRAGLRGLTRLAVSPLPADLRPFAVQDLLLVGRGFSPRAGVNAAVAAVALLAVGERALTAGPDGGRVALLAVTVAAWALASTVFVLWERQQPTLWFLADLGCPPVRLWRAKVAVAGLLGLLAGLLGALPWVGVAPSVAWRAPLLGAAVGIGVGAMLMEGDGRPLLAGVISLIAALGLGTLVIWNPLFALGALPLAAYMERLALPRGARRLGETARRL
jgi:hypothetical protein